MVYIHNGTLFGCKKNEILPFAAKWMQLEDTMLSEISQTQKDEYHCSPLIAGAKILKEKKRKQCLCASVLLQI